MNSARNVFRRKKLDQAIPVLCPDRIEMIDMPGVWGFGGPYDFGDPAECLIIKGRMLPAESVPLVEVLQFDAQNGSLNAVHPAVPADQGVVIFPNLSVVTQDPDLFVDLGVVRHNSPRFAKRAEIFAGIEAKTPNVADSADSDSFELGAMRLACILDQGNSKEACNIMNCVHVRRLPKEMHRNNGLGLGRDGVLESSGIHCVGAGIDINKHRRCTAVGNGFRCGHKGIRHRNDLIA